ncbi:MAG: T9SS type A sorting domain-containing protein [Lewinellaceae bacterium]|nr:T9SS type A sorting domain-containing protein [Lewinellaceae bacterium]
MAYNLGAGDYPVTVTDFCGNTVTGTFTVGAFPDYAIELESIDHLCPGETSGAVDISLAGGDEPFAVYWYNEGEIYYPISTGEDLSGALGGAYRVKTYDSHGCKREKPFAILASSLDQIQGAVKGSCEELSPGIGSISLSVNTPFPVTSILWDHENQTSSSISELDPGFYQVTITDTECTYELEYEVTQYTYSESPDPPGSCWDRITCGPELNQRIWTGILSTEFKSEAGACYVRALCGNGESWNPPNSSDLYWDNHDGRVENDVADIIKCWKDQICEIDWTYTDEFGITYYVFNPPEIVRSRVPFEVTRKEIGRWQPECSGSDILVEWWCGPELVDTDCLDAPEPMLPLPPSMEHDQGIVFLTAFPNPSKEHLNIAFHLKKDGFARFVLYNSTAEKLFIQEQYFQNGLNTYSLQNWGDKPGGVYILELSDGEQILGRKKIIKY